MVLLDHLGSLEFLGILPASSKLAPLDVAYSENCDSQAAAESNNKLRLPVVLKLGQIVEQRLQLCSKLRGIDHPHRCLV